MTVSEGAFGDLNILDALELFGSTVLAAESLNISQSSCSRRYRSFSNHFGLGFDRVDGQYRAQANLDILTSLRRAAQKQRVRSGRPRYGVGWQMDQLVAQPIDGIHSQALRLKPMDCWKILSWLENRLIDYWFGDILDYATLLEKPLETLKYERIQISKNLIAVPFCRWRLRAVAHHDHPLRHAKTISKEQLERYPSPSVDVSMAPSLIRQLQSLGLANTPTGLQEHDWEKWQGAASDKRTITYCAPHDEKRLAQEFIGPIEQDLQITQVGSCIGHRDAMEDPSFHQHLKCFMKACHGGQVGEIKPNINWLR